MTTAFCLVCMECGSFVDVHGGAAGNPAPAPGDQVPDRYVDYRSGHAACLVCSDCQYRMKILHITSVHLVPFP